MNLQHLVKLAYSEAYNKEMAAIKNADPRKRDATIRESLKRVSSKLTAKEIYNLKHMIGDRGKQARHIRAKMLPGEKVTEYVSRRKGTLDNRIVDGLSGGLLASTGYTIMNALKKRKALAAAADTAKTVVKAVT